MNNSRIRVCHLLGSLGSGGRESLLLDIIDNTPEGIEYILCCFRSTDDAAAAFRRRGVQVRGFDISSGRDIRGLLRLFRYLRKSEIDVLHIHGPRAQVPGRLLGRAAGIKGIVSTHHGVREMFPENALRLEEITRWLDGITIAVSEGVRHSYVGVEKPSSWRTIQNGIDVHKFNAAVTQADTTDVTDRHDLTDKLVFLNVGRYVPPKAQSDLITAVGAVADDLPPVHLLIIGGRGAMKGRLREQVRDRGLENQITVTGYVENIYSYYAAADVFVSSSTEEGLPIVLLEAMAAELPVVATDIPGVRELVVDGVTGVLVPPEQPHKLGRQLLRVTDPSLRNRMAKKGYERVLNEFDIAVTVEEHLEVYRDLAGKSDP